MSQSTKRSAHFDEDRDQQKRPRRDTERSERAPDDRRNGSKRTSPPRDRRDRSPRKDRSPRRDSRRDRSRERDKPKKDREPHVGDREREHRGRDGPRAHVKDRDKERDKDGRGLRDRDDGVRAGRQPPTGPAKGVAADARAPKTKAAKVESEVMDMDVDMNLNRPRDIADSTEEDIAAMEVMMMQLMGFKSFRSTQNTKVPGNDKLYAVSKEKKTEYRQYMNRVGGFNRPLSPSHA